MTVERLKLSAIGENARYEQFRRQRFLAEKSGVRFNLSFSDWLEIWRRSGKFAQRGPRGHQYVMARIDKRGPFEMGNISIITRSEDARNTHLGREFSDQHRRNISEGQRGRAPTRLGCKHTEEARRKISEAAKQRWAEPKRELKIVREVVRYRPKDEPVFRYRLEPVTPTIRREMSARGKFIIAESLYTFIKVQQTLPETQRSHSTLQDARDILLTMGQIYEAFVEEDLANGCAPADLS